jgi:hypothetical protein
LQSERAQAVALRIGVFVEGKKWRKGWVQGDMKLDTGGGFYFHIQCLRVWNAATNCYCC